MPTLSSKPRRLHPAASRRDGDRGHRGRERRQRRDELGELGERAARRPRRSEDADRLVELAGLLLDPHDRGAAVGLDGDAADRAVAGGHGHRRPEGRVRAGVGHEHRADRADPRSAVGDAAEGEDRALAGRREAEPPVGPVDVAALPAEEVARRSERARAGRLARRPDVERIVRLDAAVLRAPRDVAAATGRDRRDELRDPLLRAEIHDRAEAVPRAAKASLDAPRPGLAARVDRLALERDEQVAGCAVGDADARQLAAADEHRGRAEPAARRAQGQVEPVVVRAPSAVALVLGPHGGCLPARVDGHRGVTQVHLAVEDPAGAE